MKKYLIVACTVLLIVCIALMYVNNSLRNEKDRLKNNQSALMEEVEFYQDEVGRYTASVQRLELTKAELKEKNVELVKTIDRLNIKLRRVQAAAMTATETAVDIKTVIRDSIIYVVDSSKIQKLPAIKWQDPWIKVSGIIMPDSTIDLNIHSVDTLYQVIHRVPHRCWIFRWGTKAIRQEITSSNPHTRIVYTEYIELKGRKKK